MKIFVEKESIRRGLFRAYIFVSSQVIVGSSMKNNEDAIKNLKFLDELPDEFKDTLEEYKP